MEQAPCTSGRGGSSPRWLHPPHWSPHLALWTLWAMPAAAAAAAAATPTTSDHVDKVYPFGSSAEFAKWAALLKNLACGCRQLDCLSVFDQSLVLTDALQAQGLSAMAFDISSDQENDITTSVGFQKVLSYLSCVRRKGLCWLAPPCSHWTWVASSQHKRSRRVPEGLSWADPKTHYNNELASRVSTLIWLCHHWDILVVVEQPISSVMFEYLPMKLALHGGLSPCHRVVVNLCSFGAASRKPLQLVGTAAWLHQLPIIASARRVHRGLSQLASCDEGGAVTGLKDSMALSAFYPKDFATQVAMQQAIHKAQHCNLKHEAIGALIVARFFFHGQVWVCVALQSWL